MKFIKGTSGQKNKFILFDSQWSVKTNGSAFIFIEKLGNKLLPGQFGPASFSVPSGMALSPDFWSCGPNLGPLYCCDMEMCGDGVERYDLNEPRQLLSRLMIMHFNSKIIN